MKIYVKLEQPYADNVIPQLFSTEEIENQLVYDEVSEDYFIPADLWKNRLESAFKRIDDDRLYYFIELKTMRLVNVLHFYVSINYDFVVQSYYMTDNGVFENNFDGNALDFLDKNQYHQISLGDFVLITNHCEGKEECIKKYISRNLT